MNENGVNELTSSEAGFLFAASRCRAFDKVHEMVDEVTAGPLVRLVEYQEPEGIRQQEQLLEQARFCAWFQRNERVISPRRREAIKVGFDGLTGDATTSARERGCHRLVQRVGIRQGGDFSVWSHGHFDLRRWLDEEAAQPAATRLVILGAVLVGAVARTAVRRRLAALMRALPPSIGQRVQARLRAVPDLPTPVLRRINEVYCRIAATGHRPDEELALLGLFFVVSAAIFRQSRVINRLQDSLPDPIARHCRVYRIACVRSGKPELTPLIADWIFALFYDQSERRADD